MPEPILRVEKVLSGRTGRATRRLILPMELRRRSRQSARLEDGLEVHLFLPRGTVLAEGDLLQANDGSLIQVVAAAEPVLDVTAHRSIELMRAAYHLGNRHTAIQIGAEFIRLARDSVLEEMLLSLGLHVTAREAPFTPEAGAYGGGHHHGAPVEFAEEYALAQQAFQHHHGKDTPS